MFAILLPEVERHEGVTQAANSHWGIAAQVYQNQSLEQQIERLYTQLPADDILRTDVWSTWLDFHNSGPYRTRQTNFDQTDYPLINNALGCGIDYNPLDP